MQSVNERLVYHKLGYILILIVVYCQLMFSNQQHVFLYNLGLLALVNAIIIIALGFALCNYY